MPPRRPRRKNKKRRKPKLKLSKPMSLDFHTFKLNTRAQLLIDASVAGDLTNWINVHNPSSFWNGTGFSQSLDEFGHLIQLFDNYRVVEVGFKYLPYFNQYGQPLGGVDKESGMNAAPSLYIGYDPDNVGVTTTPNTILRSRKGRMKSVMNHIRYHVRAQNVNQGASAGVPYVGSLTDGWLNCQNPNANTTGVISIINDLEYQFEGVPLASGTPVGDMQFYAIIQFKNRQ